MFSFHVAGDQWGRRNTLLLSGGFFLVSATLSAFAPDLITLCILRSCVGMAVGCKLPVATAILIELTPSKDRGVSPSLSYSDNAQNVCIPRTKYESKCRCVRNVDLRHRIRSRRDVGVRSWHRHPLSRAFIRVVEDSAARLRHSRPHRISPRMVLRTRESFLAHHAASHPEI